LRVAAQNKHLYLLSWWRVTKHVL